MQTSRKIDQLTVKENFAVLRAAVFLLFFKNLRGGRISATNLVSYHNVTLPKPTPMAQLVRRWAPGSNSPDSRRSGARYTILLAGIVRGRWQRPRPVEVGELVGPCPATWAR